MSWLSQLIHHPKGAVHDITHDLTGWAGDAAKGLGQAGHFVAGQLGDAESAFSNITHGHLGRGGWSFEAPWLRDLLFAAPALVAAAVAPELLGPAAAGAEGAGATAAGTEGATAFGADLGAETATSAAFGGTDLATTAAAATTADMLPEVTVEGTSLAGSPPITSMVETAAAPPWFAQASGNPTASTGGVAPDTLPPPAVPDLSGFPSVGDPSMAVPPPSAGPPPDVTGFGTEGFDPNIPDSAAPDSFATKMMNYLKTPKGALTAGMSGMSLLNALSKPKLPGTAKQAAGLAGPAAAQAQQVISSGGYSAPQWNQQKQSIDAMVDQEIQDASRAMQQNAINSGMGTKSSDVVQQELAGLKERANTQRQMLYAQALQQNINNAVAELTGADQTLMGVANMQLQQSEEARQLSAQLAEMAAWLNVGGTPPRSV